MITGLHGHSLGVFAVGWWTDRIAALIVAAIAAAEAWHTAPRRRPHPERQAR